LFHVKHPDVAPDVILNLIQDWDPESGSGTAYIIVSRETMIGV